MRPLCDIADLPPGTALGFPSPDPAIPGLFAVHGPQGIAVYVNACPHLGVPLDWLPGRFLNADATRIVCATHGAEFLLPTGHCTRGPCKGDALTRVPCTVLGSLLMVEDAAEA
jgi:nitrite reductase/ring-hydroxylating ferredoxin subunit